MKYEKFKVSKEHIALLRSMYVSWNHGESGAPSIDPKRPYGNSDVLKSVSRIVGNYKYNNTKLAELHLDMEKVLQIYLCLAGTGELLNPGTYYKANTSSLSWTKFYSVRRKIRSPKKFILMKRNVRNG